MPPSLYTGIILSATPTWINLKTAFWSPRPHYCFHPHWKRSCSRADDSVCVIFVCRLFTLWHLSVLIGQYSISNENERMGSCQHLQGWCGASLQLTQLGQCSPWLTQESFQLSPRKLWRTMSSQFVLETQLHSWHLNPIQRYVLAQQPFNSAKNRGLKLLHSYVEHSKLATAQSALTFREQFSFMFNKCAKNNNNNQRVCQCRTWAAQRACGRPRSRWPSGSFHWGRQTGRREPNTHRPAHLDHCWTAAWTKRWDKETPDKITQTRGQFNIGTTWSVQEIWL